MKTLLAPFVAFVAALRSMRTAASAAYWSVLTLGTSNAMAALPTTADPSQAPADGNYIELIKGYAYDIGIVLGLVLGLVAFLVVVNNMIGVYKEIGAGKKSWGDMGMHGGMGVLLLVFCIFLLTEASTIIFDV
jgi:integrating conjugative element membrane protein (TIGR03745 family)